MISPPLSDTEDQRLATLYSYQILDTLPDPSFDALTQLASQICGTPIALVSLIDKDRQWFKSRVGLDVPQTTRNIAFCTHALANGETLIVKDAIEDQRFFDNPLVLEDPHIRFYAGVPLAAKTGDLLGTLCVIDRTPRELNEFQLATLNTLAHQVELLLQQHHINLELHQALIDVHRAQAAEKKAQYLLSEACQLSKMGAWEIDLSTMQAIWSKELIALYGLDEQMSFDDSLTQYSPDTRAFLLSQFQESIKTGRDFEIEVPRNAPNQTIKWLKHIGKFRKDESGHVLNLYGMTQDITAQKTVQILHDKNHFYQNLLQTLSLQVHIIQDDLIQKSLQILSEFYECGVDIRKLSDQGLVMIDSQPMKLDISDDLNIRLDDYLLKHYGQEGILKLNEMENESELISLLNNQGILKMMSETIWVNGEAYAFINCYNYHCINTPYASESDFMNTLCRWLGFMLERVLYIQELQMLNDQQNMILGLVAHDLRSPLATIQMANMQNQRLLKQDQPVNPVMLNIIEQSCKSAAGLIDELLEVAQNQDAGFETELQKLSPIMETILNPFAEKIKSKDLELIWQNNAPEACAQIRSKKFIRVIENLLHNAFKFTANGGTITVSLNQLEDEICIAIQDTGIGIPEHLVGVIFDKFTKARRKGTANEESHGLGMFISHDIIAKHGGRIEVVSKEGKGSCFSVYLPLVKVL